MSGSSDSGDEVPEWDGVSCLGDIWMYYMGGCNGIPSDNGGVWRRANISDHLTCPCGCLIVVDIISSRSKLNIILLSLQGSISWIYNMSILV